MEVITNYGLDFEVPRVDGPHRDKEASAQTLFSAHKFICIIK